MEKISLMICKILIFPSMLLLVSNCVLAYDIDVKITGEIHVPPCVINNGNPIEVDFGDIPIHKIGSIIGNEFQKINQVPLQCDFNDGTPYLSVKGNKIINEEVLNTTGINTNKLGVMLYFGDSISNDKIVINSLDNNGYGQNITTGILHKNVRDTEFIFTSVPIKIGQDRLDVGPFSAVATFSIHYF